MVVEILAVEMRDISKSFFGVKVLDQVNFSVQPGEIHALAGENGAGKSTLMKILQGVYSMDAGEIFIAGESATINSFQEARNYGIGMVFQEFSLIPELTIAQNIFLNRENKTKLGLIDDLACVTEAQQVLFDVGIDIDVKAKVSTLSRAYQQLTEIAKALAANAKLLILDEPTASLAKHEVDVLFKVLRGLTARGVSIIYISHRMDEIYQICDRITILRDGKWISTSALSAITPKEIISHIIGRKELESSTQAHRDINRSGTPLLEVRDICVGTLIKNVSFQLFQGEILGLVGLMGSGRTELVRALFGLDKKSSGTVLINGLTVSINNPRDAIAARLAFIPEDRRRQGLIMEHSISTNLAANNLKELSHLSFMNFDKVSALSVDAIKKFEIRPPEATRQVKLLSGGNQQKVVIAKWIATNPLIVLMDEPTVGVDIGTKVEIMKLIQGLADEGKAVIIISSELPEIMGVCNRILVLKNGEIRENLDRKDVLDVDRLQILVQGIEA